MSDDPVARRCFSRRRSYGRDGSLDFIVVNGENAAGGFGVTESILEEFLAAGVDAVTLGNHAFDQREALVFIDRQPRLVRPANYPPGTPGRGAAIVENAKGARLLIVNLLGRIFMEALDDPFAALDRELAAHPLGEACHASVVDVHCEATSEKWALAHYADGRASLVVGTHTHVPSASPSDPQFYSPRVRAGGRLPHCWVESCDGRVSTLDLVSRDELTLLTSAGGYTAWSAAAEGLSMSVALLGDGELGVFHTGIAGADPDVLVVRAGRSHRRRPALRPGRRRVVAASAGSRPRIRLRRC